MAQDIFRIGALAGGIDGLPLEIGRRLDGIPIFENVQDSQGVDGQHSDLASGLIVQYRGQIGGCRRDIHLVVEDFGADLIGGGGYGKGVVIACRTLFLRIHQMDHADPGRAFDGLDPDGGFGHRGSVRGGGGRGFRRRGRAARDQKGREQRSGGARKEADETVVHEKNSFE